MSASDVTPEHVHDWRWCVVCGAEGGDQFVCWCGEHEPRGAEGVPA
jgi:hypothetical protein